MRILLSHFGIYKKSGWGRTFMIAKGLARNGNTVTLLTNSPKKGLLYRKRDLDGVNVIIFSDIIPETITKKGFGLVSFINRIVYSLFHKYTIVHADSHRPNSYYPCLVNRFLHKSKLFVEWWDNFGSEGQLPNKNIWFKIFLGNWEKTVEVSSKIKADGVIVLSKYMLKKAVDIGIKESKIGIVHGGANIEDIKQLPFNYMKNSRFGLDENTITFGFIGTGDADMKELSPLIEVLRRFGKQYDLKLLYYGTPTSQKVKKDLNLDSIIIECGWIDYSKDSSLLAAVDYFVLIKEVNIKNLSGWPNKFGDYLACGRPVLLNPYGDLNVFIDKYNPGVILVEDSIKGIEKAVHNICMGKYDKIELGQRNRHIAENYISWEARSLQLKNYYLTLTLERQKVSNNMGIK